MSNNENNENNGIVSGILHGIAQENDIILTGIFDTSLIKPILEDVDEETNENMPNKILLPIIELLTNKLLEEGINIELNNIPTIMSYSMEIVEDIVMKSETIPNQEKKQIAKDIVVYLIKNSPLDESTKTLCNEILTGSLLDDLIEIIIKASKVKLGLNSDTIEDVVEITGKCCAPFLGKLRNKTNTKAKPSAKTITNAKSVV